MFWSQHLLTTSASHMRKGRKGWDEQTRQEGWRWDLRTWIYRDLCKHTFPCGKSAILLRTRQLTLCAGQQQPNLNVSIQNVLKAARTVTSHVTEFYVVLFVSFLLLSLLFLFQTNQLSSVILVEWLRHQWIHMGEAWESFSQKGVGQDWTFLRSKVRPAKWDRAQIYKQTDFSVHESAFLPCMCPWFK